MTQRINNLILKQANWDLPGGPVVKNLPSTKEDTGSITSQGTKIPHAVGQISPHTTTRESPHTTTRESPHTTIKTPAHLIEDPVQSKNKINWAKDLNRHDFKEVIVCVSCSVVSNSLWPHGSSPPWCDPTSSLLCPQNSAGKNTGVGCYSLLHRSSWPRDQTWVSCIAGRFFTNWAIRETLNGQ